MKKLVLFGIRSPLLPDYEDCCSRLGMSIAMAVHTDELRPRLLNKGNVVELNDLPASAKGLPFIACAFSPKRRGELASMAIEAGLLSAEPLIDKSAIVPDSTRVGNGSFINAGVIIGSAGIIGEHVFINRASNLGHHAFIEDYVSVGPGVTAGGNVHMGEGAFIGAGSVILPGVRIGAGAVVAAGSVVRSEVAPGVLVAGSPAQVKRETVSPTVYGEVGEE